MEGYDINQIINNADIEFENEEQYYFTLAQTLTAVFIILGGVDKYRNEYNYLTNPYTPMAIYELAKRILKFSLRFRNNYSISNPQLIRVIDALLISSDKFVNNTKINDKKAEVAFYIGLHRECFFSL